MIALFKFGLDDEPRTYWEPRDEAPQGCELASEAQVRQAAEAADVPWTALRALIQVESRQAGLIDGKPPIWLDERIWRLVGGRRHQLPRPLNPPDSRERWVNFEKLAHHDRLNAILCARLGLAQLSGMNSNQAGYANENLYFAAMMSGVGQQLAALARYISHPDGDLMRQAMIRGDCDAVGFHFNGPGYAAVRWHEKYRAAVRRFTYG